MGITYLVVRHGTEVQRNPKLPFAGIHEPVFLKHAVNLKRVVLACCERKGSVASRRVWVYFVMCIRDWVVP